MSLNLFSTLVGESSVMNQLYQDLSGLACIEQAVLLLGESATGKDSAAYELHCESERAEGEFVMLNCAAIQTDLIETEMFGHVKGAFSGALADKIGRLGLAHQGTLFLDDIDQLSMPIQLKLLNALVSKEYFPVGSDMAQPCDVRLVVGASESIKQKVDEGYFSAELYALLKPAIIAMPPLRERTEDLASLFQVLFTKVQADNEETPFMHASALNALQNYDWPGNIRELECLVESLAADYAGQIVQLEHLPERYQQGRSRDQLPLGLIQDEMTYLLSGSAGFDEVDGQFLSNSDTFDNSEQPNYFATIGSPGLVVLPTFDLESGVPIKDFLQQVECEILCGALEKTSGNVSQAAKLLKINRTTLVEKIRKYDLRDSNIA